MYVADVMLPAQAPPLLRCNYFAFHSSKERLVLEQGRRALLTSQYPKGLTSSKR